MAVKKIIVCTIPNKLTKHFFQTEAAIPFSATLADLSRTAYFEEKIIATLKYKDALTVRYEVTWNSREDCDRNDGFFYAAHPNYLTDRDSYNLANNCTWTTTYEDVPD